MKCLKCGKENPPDASFCNACGTASQPSPHYQAASSADRISALKVILGIIAIFVVFYLLAWNDHNSSSPRTSSQPQITLSKYNQLQDGMSYSQVVQILGKPGVEISSSSIGGYKTVMIQWDVDEFGANMNAMFQNGKLISKAQFGLK